MIRAIAAFSIVDAVSPAPGPDPKPLEKKLVSTGDSLGVMSFAVLALMVLSGVVLVIARKFSGLWCFER